MCMKSSTAIAIGVGAAAAVVIGIAAAVSAKPPPVTPPPPSGCTCPSGDVCPDSNGVCPSGYIPDPNAAGCCAKCVQAAPCSCSEIFDTVLCECSALIPATVDMPISFSVYPFWMVYNGCSVNGGVCSGYEGENLSACMFVAGECNHDALLFTIKGTVTDSSGHPICNVPLNFSSNLSEGTSGTIPWTTPDGNFEGEWGVGLGTPSETDSSGGFSIDVTVNIAITAYKSCCDPFECKAQTVNSMPFPLTITVSIPGTQIEATSVIEVANTICEWQNM